MRLYPKLKWAPFVLSQVELQQVVFYCRHPTTDGSFLYREKKPNLNTSVVIIWSLFIVHHGLSKSFLIYLELVLTCDRFLLGKPRLVDNLQLIIRTVSVTLNTGSQMYTPHDCNWNYVCICTKPDTCRQILFIELYVNYFLWVDEHAQASYPLPQLPIKCMKTYPQLVVCSSSLYTCHWDTMGKNMCSLFNCV